jgi:hypothetical protein
VGHHRRVFKPALLALLTPLFAACASSAVGSGSGSCQDSLRELRVQNIQLKRSLVSNTAPTDLFRDGEPLPDLEATLRPELAAEVERTRGELLSLTCRTWVCRITIVTALDAPYPRVLEVMGHRSLRVILPPFRDVHPVANTPVEWRGGWIILAHPRGEPRPFPAVAQLAREAPVPADDQKCATERQHIDAENQKLRRRLSYVGDAMTQVYRYEAENPALVEEIAPLLSTALNWPSLSPSDVLSCRGPVCQTKLPVTSEGYDRVMAFQPIARRLKRIVRVVGGVSGKQSRTWLSFEVGEGAYADGGAILKDLRARFDASASRCDQKPPARGAMETTLRLEPTDAQGPEPRIVVDFAGSLVETPRGRCLTQLWSELIAATPLPRAVSGVRHYHEVSYGL